MNRIKIGTLTSEEKETLNRLERFAQRNGLELFNVKGSLYDRVKTITVSNGACPCLPKERPHCPCKECIRECKERGECFCRVFIKRG